MNRLPYPLSRPPRARIRVAGDERSSRRHRFLIRSGALTAAVLALMALTGRPARAVDASVEFGAPTVLSQQGQRLKVLLPVRSAPNDRATAASFLVRETEVPQGHPPLPAQDFVVMRPARADYVVLQSAGVVRAPQVALVVSVAGDPRSPYRMDLQVPPANTTVDRIALAGEAADRARRSAGAVRGAGPGRDAAAGRDTATHRDTATRRLRGPTGDPTLPPK